MCNVQNTVWLLLLALAFASPTIAARQFEVQRNAGLQHNILQYVDRLRSGWTLPALCIPTASQTLEDHEGRHKCAYDHSNGFRAVGVGYNLDDNVNLRRAELSTLFADYDKVYKNESCLWDIQITALLGLDSNRALNGAAAAVDPLDDFCCEVEAVFADIQHSLKGSEAFPLKDMQTFIEKAAAREWGEAAQELNKTEWCSTNGQRCLDNIDTVNSGCNSLMLYL